MPFPINKIQDEMIDNKVQSQNMSNILPLLELNDFFGDFLNATGDMEKNAIIDIWLHGQTAENKIKAPDNISQQDIEILKNKGLVKGQNRYVEFTESGKKVLKQSILDDEKSTLTKSASKQMINKNSYDFGDEVLVKINHPERIGARYISIGKKIVSKKNIIPTKINNYQIDTKKENGEWKNLKDYSDKELIQTLHLANKIIKSSSKIALATTTYIPVHRLKRFSELIMEEINSKERI